MPPRKSKWDPKAPTKATKASKIVTSTYQPKLGFDTLSKLLVESLKTNPGPMLANGKHKLTPYQEGLLEQMK